MPRDAKPRASPAAKKAPKDAKSKPIVASNASSKKRKLDTKAKKEEALAKRAKAISEAQRDARHELVVKCNKLWNELRQKDLEDAKRVELSADIFKLLKGKVLSFAQRPDTSRVIQSLFKFGDSMVRKAILDELSKEFAALSKGKHSSFLVVTLLRYGDEEDRAKVASELRESVRSLGTHANGARVVNYCICGSTHDSQEENVITDSERKRFYERFYGNDVVLFGNTSGSTKDYSLAQYLPSDEAKRASTLQYLKRLVLKMAEKGLLRFPYAQYLCFQFVANAPREEVCEMIPSVSEAALAMVGTWEGAQSVVQCLLAADAKDRKKIIKEWKDHVVDLCAHRFGWYVVTRALDSVDDTKLLEKSIVEEICEDEEKLEGLIEQEDGFGRKAFMRILAPDERCSHYFERFEETFLKDRSGLSTSKKDPEVRRSEVFKAMRAHLFNSISAHADEMIKSLRGTDVIRELFYRDLGSDDADGAKAKAIAALVEAAPGSLDDARGHVTLKRIVKDETKWLEQDASHKLDSDLSFAAKLAQSLKGKFGSLAKANRAAFVFEALASHPLSRDMVKKEISAVKSKLPKDVKGVEALLKAVSGK